MPIYFNEIIVDSNVGSVLLNQPFFDDKSEHGQQEKKWLENVFLAKHIATTIHYAHLYKKNTGRNNQQKQEMEVSMERLMDLLLQYVESNSSNKTNDSKEQNSNESNFFANNPLAKEILDLFLLEWECASGPILGGRLKDCLSNPTLIEKMTLVGEKLNLSKEDQSYFFVKFNIPLQNVENYEELETVLASNNQHEVLEKIKKQKKELIDRELSEVQTSNDFLEKAKRKLENDESDLSSVSIRGLLYTLNASQVKNILEQALKNKDELFNFMIANNDEDSGKAITWMVLDYMAARERKTANNPVNHKQLDNNAKFGDYPIYTSNHHTLYSCALLSNTTYVNGFDNRAKEIIVQQKSDIKEVFCQKPLAEKALNFYAAADSSTYLGEFIATKQEGNRNEPSAERGRLGAICRESKKATKELLESFLSVDNGYFANMSDILTPMITELESTSRRSSMLWRGSMAENPKKTENNNNQKNSLFSRFTTFEKRTPELPALSDDPRNTNNAL